MNNIGLYLHIPFCKSKCPYCDFYSGRGDKEDFDDYTMCLIESMQYWADNTNAKADTLYFGGGTPSLLGGDNIALLTKSAKNLFGVDGEITVECNPSAIEKDFFKKIESAGVNRVSFGMQSAVDYERKKLGRISDRKEIEKCINDCRDAGIENITLDIMLGIPDQTMESLKESLDFCIQTGVPHISAYMLKVEEGTFLQKNINKYNLPDEDLTADMYLFMSDYLQQNGFVHYEISNFAREGYEGKHNLKYWNCEEYIGIGPSAHSFYHGKRFFYPRDLQKFKLGSEPVYDGDGGDEEEYIMLRLRLKSGINFDDFEKRFNKKISEKIIKKLQYFSDKNYAEIDEKSAHLTPKGFLISNTIISDLLD